jgi:hypothetical protein
MFSVSAVMFESENNRGASDVCMYALYLYFLGLSFRNTSKAMEPFEEEVMYNLELGTAV